MRHRHAPTGSFTRGDGSCTSRGISEAVGISRANRSGNCGTYRPDDSRS
ncbi:MAG: hypothetical protein KTV68_07685 [Acidimicrobiia bacterium]|nr:hypothetical protein [Acidimicrobiia bacterium]MCY4433982.1 hypothetical protein [bacterium]